MHNIIFAKVELNNSLPFHSTSLDRSSWVVSVVVDRTVDSIVTRKRQISEFVLSVISLMKLRNRIRPRILPLVFLIVNLHYSVYVDFLNYCLCFFFVSERLQSICAFFQLFHFASVYVVAEDDRSVFSPRRCVLQNRPAFIWIHVEIRIGYYYNLDVSL